jgi:hypothetical protein
MLQVVLKNILGGLQESRGTWMMDGKGLWLLSRMHRMLDTQTGSNFTVLQKLLVRRLFVMVAAGQTSVAIEAW